MNESTPLLLPSPHVHSKIPSPLSTSLLPSSSSPSITSSEEDQAAEPKLSPEELRISQIRWISFWLILLFSLSGIIIYEIKTGKSTFDWEGALRKGLGGGLAGGAAMILNVLTLMPLRTILNYQYRYGGDFLPTVTHLNTSGLTRFYSGLSIALLQGPLSRFFDTFSNVAILSLLSSSPNIPLAIKTILSSILGAGLRMILVPVDTVKTTLQTQGSGGIELLKERIKNYGIGTLWNGAFATAAASFVGSLPWFFVYNQLDGNLPLPVNLLQTLLRQALIGFTASAISDSISNSLRILKTYRQVNKSNISYYSIIKIIYSNEGLKGILGRGLKTRILSNGLQGLMFSVLWKLFLEVFNGEGN